MPVVMLTWLVSQEAEVAANAMDVDFEGMENIGTGLAFPLSKSDGHQLRLGIQSS